MSNLSKETTDRIEKEAEAYAETHGDHITNIKEYSTHNDVAGAYNAGATEWAGRAQGLVLTLELINTWIDECMGYGKLLDADKAMQAIDTALAKYKEVGNG
jgi:hypothetical protein